MKTRTIKQLSLPLPNLAMPDQGQVDVWLMQLQNLPIMQAEAPKQIRARLAQRRMGQKFILRLLLGAYLETPGHALQIKNNRYGKPELTGQAAESGLSFNLSHAGEWLAIAVAKQTPVGIDIESTERSLRWKKLSRRYFSPVEADWLETMSEQEAGAQFLKHWTAREALIKAMGRTIAGNISSVILAAKPAAEIQALPEHWPEANQWQLSELDLKPGLVTHLASPTRIHSVQLFELKL